MVGQLLLGTNTVNLGSTSASKEADWFKVGQRINSKYSKKFKVCSDVRKGIETGGCMLIKNSWPVHNIKGCPDIPATGTYKHYIRLH